MLCRTDLEWCCAQLTGDDQAHAPNSSSPADDRDRPNAATRSRRRALLSWRFVWVHETQALLIAASAGDGQYAPSTSSIANNCDTNNKRTARLSCLFSFPNIDSEDEKLMIAESKKAAQYWRLVEKLDRRAVAAASAPFGLSSLVDCSHSPTKNVDDATRIEPLPIAQPEIPGCSRQSVHAAKSVCAEFSFHSTGAIRCSHAHYTARARGPPRRPIVRAGKSLTGSNQSGSYFKRQAIRRVTAIADFCDTAEFCRRSLSSGQCVYANTLNRKSVGERSRYVK